MIIEDALMDFEITYLHLGQLLWLDVSAASISLLVLALLVVGIRVEAGDLAHLHAVLL